MDNGNDNSRCPAKQDDSVDRLKGCQEAPLFVEDDIAVSQGGEGDP